ncbi:hypothetical protein CALCODRAFT_484276 [Calocera cornea HHB12733]|uniref:Alpha-type protein kinase domain-containing protein n=1 Tax=Calocera cornea HHB12733 TaxID=1353952 RepID=A0A165F2P9_9BASI|nr:hypothetical protein CALCODRAFT_484276 [Calocera cornea HHB12733]
MSPISKIMTDPKLGQLFAEGNVKAAFEKFTEQHQCNMYCRYFELRPLAKMANNDN